MGPHWGWVKPPLGGWLKARSAVLRLTQRPNPLYEFGASSNWKSFRHGVASCRGRNVCVPSPARIQIPVFVDGVRRWGLWGA